MHQFSLVTGYLHIFRAQKACHHQSELFNISEVYGKSLGIWNISSYYFRPLRTSSSLKSKPTQVLPDGTIVVPIGSEDDEDGIEPGSDENESKYGTILDKMF